MKSLKHFWEWFVGLFKREAFEEVLLEEPDPPAEPVVEKPEDELIPELPEDLVFSCNDGAVVPPEYYGNASLLATNLRILSRELGEPLVLFSVHRSPEYNKHVGGLEASAHLTCSAADFSVAEHELTDVANKIGELVDSGKMSPGSVTLNPGFIHYELI